MDAIQIETGPRPEAAVIWLHGLGADGHDFEPIVPELELPKPVRFVFPHAPIRPVTINNGMRMRAWYDIFQFGGGREDEQGLRASQKLVDEMIRAQGLPPEKIVLAGFSQGGAIVLQAGLRYAERLAGIMALSCYLPIASTVAAERIVLAGFSQGGAIALHTALREPRRLGGVLALSTYLPLAATLAKERSEANAGVPIFMAHGNADPVLPLALAERSRRALEDLGYSVDWHVYPMPHAVCPQEIAAIDRWLAAVAPAAAA
jgi:phospholipase/carboxylesterase